MVGVFFGAEMMRMLELNFNAVTTNTEAAFLHIPSITLIPIIDQTIEALRGLKQTNVPPAGTSFTSLSCWMEDKAFLIALQYLHFHARSCWRFGWRNDACVCAARMHFWLLLGCVDAGALLPSTVISLKCWERERRDRITIPRGSIITLGGFILSLNAPPPSLFSDAAVKIYIVLDNETHFSFLVHDLILETWLEKKYPLFADNYQICAPNPSWISWLVKGQ